MSTHYSVRHLTRFAYAVPVSESVMELRMQPRSEGLQRCLHFDLVVVPRARVFAYRDSLGNWVHHFDIPRRHSQLAITSRAVVQVDAPPPLNATFASEAWRVVDEWVESGEHWDFRQPSRFAVWSDPLLAYVDGAVTAPRDRDPVTLVREVMAAIHRDFEYAPNTTRVDSPIDEALEARRGVCQDFAHIMLAALRHHDLPCRYVSGYIAPGGSSDVRRAGVASHAWIEVLLPDVGWWGFDPTHNAEAGTRHIRVAVGRDYADVPPTRGVFKGKASNALTVSVEVTPTDGPALDVPLPEATWVAEGLAEAAEAEREQQLQMQQ